VSPARHINGSGCYKCGRLAATLKIKEKITKDSKWFIEQAILIHGDRYDYSKSQYTHSHKSISIICQIHGKFEQVACYHLQGSGCKLCQYDAKRLNYTKFKSDKDIMDILKSKSCGKITLVSASKLNFNSEIELCCTDHGLFKSTIKSISNNKFICIDCKNTNASILNTK
jgi:hypothetical protein